MPPTYHLHPNVLFSVVASTTVASSVVVPSPHPHPREGGRRSAPPPPPPPHPPLPHPRGGIAIAIAIPMAISMAEAMATLGTLSPRSGSTGHSSSGILSVGAYPSVCTSYKITHSLVPIKTMGRDTVQIRKTDETPPRVSTIAAVIAVTGKSHHHAAQDFRWLSDQYPEVGTSCSLFTSSS